MIAKPNQRLAALVLSLAVLNLGSMLHPAEARARHADTWTVSDITDPITGVRRCVVAAYDRGLGMSYSRAGYLYPIVELNSELGLLVGVSSGGRIRLPTGNILWRVDDLPFRELLAADNPTSITQAQQPDSNLQAPTDYQMRLIRATTATATVASGEKARAMLAELASGRSLIFRAGGSAPAFGLPSESSTNVGQITADGQRPFAIDDSFYAGLARCSIQASEARKGKSDRAPHHNDARKRSHNATPKLI